MRTRLTAALLLLLLLLGFGTFGYRMVGGPDTSMSDCLYMTVITLSTVGYGEIVDLTGRPGARMFTVLLIVFGMGTLLYFVSNITAIIVDGALQDIFATKKMARKLKRCRGHYVVCGSSSVAQHIVEELIVTGHRCVVVSDSKEELDLIAARWPHALRVQGDPQEQSVLCQAGALRAAGLLAALSDDRDNLAVIFAAKALGCPGQIVARAISPRSCPKLERAGADRVVLTEQICGNRLVNELLHAPQVGFLELMLRTPQRVLRVEDAIVSLRSPLAGKSVPEAQIKRRTGALVLGICRREDGALVSPSREQRIAAGDTLVAITDLDAKAALRRLARGWRRKGERPPLASPPSPGELGARQAPDTDEMG